MIPKQSDPRVHWGLWHVLRYESGAPYCNHFFEAPGSVYSRSAELANLFPNEVFLSLEQRRGNWGFRPCRCGWRLGAFRMSLPCRLGLTDRMRRAMCTGGGGGMLSLTGRADMKLVKLEL